MVSNPTGVISIQTSALKPEGIGNKNFFPVIPEFSCFPRGYKASPE
jgi:hypothetical protein